MSVANWEASLAIILKEEGGNDDDPRDPGGRTSRGITQREWNAYRETKPTRPADVWQASSDDVETIYHLQYWEPYCDDLPAGVDLVFFNTCVNSGRAQAVKELQRALGFNPADGMMGIVTFNAIDAHRDIPELIKTMCEMRRNFYKALKTFATFGKGWLARTDRIEKAALSMVVVSVTQSKMIAKAYPEQDTQSSEPQVTTSSKASSNDADTPAISPEASGATAAGTATVAGTITQIQQQLSPFTDTLKVVQYVLLAVSVIGIVYMIFGMVKRARVAKAVN